MAVNATAVWRVRPSGNNTNGGGFDSAITGAGTDYSQQNAAQVTGTHGTGTGTTTFTDLTASDFTSAMVGNCINISGQGFYFVVTFTDASHVVVDRALGTFTLASWSLGGGWADFWTNINTGNPVNGSNVVYILGSGTPNPAAYTYDYVCNTETNPPVTSNGGFIIFANDPLTPGYKAPPDTTGGMPTIQCAVDKAFRLITSGTKVSIRGLWFVGATTPTLTMVAGGEGGAESLSVIVFGCIFDQFGIDCFAFGVNSSTGLVAIGAMIGCEVFSSKTGTITAGGFAIQLNTGVGQISGCNFHDLVAACLVIQGGSWSIDDTIVSTSYNSASVNANVVASTGSVYFKNCTFDNWANACIFIQTNAPYNVTVLNCILSNSGTGLSAQIGSASVNGPGFLMDYNVYYNNTTDLNNLNYGPHDTHGGANPYVGQATENYTLL